MDDYFSALALENKDKIALRNEEILNKGLSILTEWLNGEIYVKAFVPKGGTTAFLRYKKEIPSRTLCRELQSKTGVALLPGETFDMEGFVRVGLCVEPEHLRIGLKEFSKFLRKIK